MSDSNEKRRTNSKAGESNLARSSPPPLPSRSKPKPPIKSRKKANNKGQSTAVVWSAIAAGIVIVLLVVGMFVFSSKSKTVVEKDGLVPTSPGVEQDKNAASPNANELAIAETESSLEQQSVLEPNDKEVPASEALGSTDSSEIASESSTEESQSDHSVEVADASTESEEAKTVEENPTETEEELVAADPGNSDLDAMIEQAAGLMQSRKPKEAIVVLKRASVTFPQEIRPDFYLGLMYSGVGENDMKNAELFFKKALDRVPGHVATSNNLALVFIKQRKFRSAWTFFTAASKDPRPLDVDQNLGRLQNQARILEAKKEDQKLIDSFKVNSANYRVDKGWFYMPVDDTAKMLAEFKPFCRNGNLEDQSCSYCNGEGSLKCRACAGRRGVVVTGTATQTMRSELNPNAPIVLSSPTGGVIGCPTCLGRGRVDCQHCEKGIDRRLR